MTLVALYKKELGETLFNFRGGSWLLLVAVVILSVVSLLSVTIDKFNLVDQKHIILFVGRLTIILGALITLVQASDAFAGERERRTLEALLLAPVSNQLIVWAKLLSALTVWLLFYVLSLPYIYVMSAGLTIFPAAAASIFVFGTPLVMSLAALAVAISTRLDSSKASVSFALLIALTLFGMSAAPPLLIASDPGKFLDTINPAAGAFHALAKIINDEQSVVTQWQGLLAVGSFLAGAVAIMIAFTRTIPLSGGKA